MPPQSPQEEIEREEQEPQMHNEKKRESEQEEVMTKSTEQKGETGRRGHYCPGEINLGSGNQPRLLVRKGEG